jgi:hypothetical protein
MLTGKVKAAHFRRKVKERAFPLAAIRTGRAGRYEEDRKGVSPGVTW